MDQNKRLVLFFLLTGLVWFGWFGFVQPKFFPAPKPQPKVAQDLDDPAEDLAEDGQVDDGQAEDVEAVAASETDQAPPAADLEEPKNPLRTVELGSLDPESGYFEQVTLTSRGAAVKSIALNDPRYSELSDRKKPLLVVGSTANEDVNTLQTSVDLLDKQLASFKTTSAETNWKLERTIPDPAQPGITQGAVFTLKAPDGSLEVSKTYTLRKVEDSSTEHVRDFEHEGYMLDVKIGFENLSDTPQKIAYTLLGPTGTPLENEEHTSKYRDLELGFLEEDGTLSHATMAATDVIQKAEAVAAAEEASAKAAAADRRLKALQKTIDDLQAQVAAKPSADLSRKLTAARDKFAAEEEAAKDLTDEAQSLNRGLERWDTPFRYLGVELQYFAALLLPTDDRPISERFKERWIEKGEPVVVEKAEKSQFSDVSFKLTSEPITVPAGEAKSHSWELFTGPKRTELLEPLGAVPVLDLSWFAVVSPAMLWILEKLHSVGLPYWLAIIGLTVIVRGAMFPISRKQAIGAAKMKELQPKLTELKEKYGKDQEKFLRAQMELFRKHGYGPLGPMASGCLPVLLQLPIFIGLYQALQTSVDLRMASFLWIDNLAAPDQLWREPFPPVEMWLPIVGEFTFPFIGGDVNILPVFTVVLFYIQQKLFMPPATTPEQEAQYKMMNFMMLFMGIFFYHVPAGLCLYFIASSLWSIAERTLLSKTKAAHIGPAEAAEIEHEIEELDHEQKPGRKGKARRGSRPVAPSEPRKSGWFGKLFEGLFEAAENARKQAELGGDKTRPSGPKSKSRTRR